MFEQSLLVDHGGARKTATFAASLTAQILAAGVLLVAPLLYHQVLPALRVPEMVPVLTTWRPPEAPARPSQPPARSAAMSLPGSFHPPVLIHTAYPQAGMIVVDVDAPVISAAPNIPGFPIGLPGLSRIEGPPAVAVVKPAIVKPVEAPVPVGGDVQSAKLIKRVVPVYPQAARQIRVSGTVHLLGIIARDGTIQKLQVLSGHPLLRQAALEAVSQWVYRPTILNGQPVEVEAPIDVIFTLSR